MTRVTLYDPDFSLPAVQGYGPTQSVDRPHLVFPQLEILQAAGGCVGANLGNYLLD